MAAAGKGVVCTKPLARTGPEAEEILKVVTEAGVWHGYAESSVFSPNIAKAHEIVEAGGIGDVLWMRAREGHPARTPPTSGTPRPRAAARCWTWAATPSSRPGTSSARTTRSSRSSRGARRWPTRTRPPARTPPSRC